MSCTGGKVTRADVAGVLTSAARSGFRMAKVFGTASARTKNTTTFRTKAMMIPTVPNSRSARIEVRNA